MQLSTTKRWANAWIISSILLFLVMILWCIASTHIATKGITNPIGGMIWLSMIMYFVFIGGGIFGLMFTITGIVTSVKTESKGAKILGLVTSILWLAVFIFSIVLLTTKNLKPACAFAWISAVMCIAGIVFAAMAKRRGE